jgi:LacI family transcriptional regulator
MVKLSDIAKALGVSIGTVDRALHNRSRIDPVTKQRVLQAAKAMGYRANLAASVLASRRRLRISVNLPVETRYFYDEVRDGINAEYEALAKFAVEIEFRPFPRLGVEELEAFDSALNSGVDGIIAAFSDPIQTRTRIQKALRRKIPVVAVVTGSPLPEKVGTVSIDPSMSGALAAGLIGGFLKRNGKIAMETGDIHTWEHREKTISFKKTIGELFPDLSVLPVIETHERYQDAFTKTLAILDAHKDLVAYYVSTVNSLPVIDALKARGLLGKITLVTTDIFPKLIPHLRSGAVAASLYQRPKVQGELALRSMYGLLREDTEPLNRIMLQPHIVMRANLQHFLRQVSQSTGGDRENSHPRHTRL